MLSALASAALFGAACSPQAAAGIVLVVFASAVYHAEETRQRDAGLEGGEAAEEGDSYARLVEGQEPPLEPSTGVADEPVQEKEEGEQRQRLVSVGGVVRAWNSRRQEG